MKCSTIYIAAAIGIFAYASTPARAQWHIQTTLSGNPPLYAVKAVSRDVAWIVGDAASDVYRTIDAGRNWRQRTAVAPDSFLTFVDALDSLTAFVGTFNPNGAAGLYRTIDGGESWHLVYLPPRPDNNYWDWIHFMDAQNGIALCDQAVPNHHWLIVKTSDGGATWTPLANPPAGNLNEYSFQSVVFFYDDFHGWFGTGPLNEGDLGGRVFRTTDGGNTWTGFDSGNTGLVVAVRFISAMVGIRTSTAPPFLTRSVDGGETWTPVNDLPVSNIQLLTVAASVHTPNASQIWVSGEADTSFSPVMMTSIDSGETWHEQTLPDLSGNSIYHMSAVSFGASGDSVQAFAVTLDPATFTSGGQILNYRQAIGFVTSVNEERPSLPLNYSLSQNYPNPFTPLDNLSRGGSPRRPLPSNGVNPQTTVTFVLAERGKVTLTIYNALGAEVEKLVNAELPAGFHQAAWNGRNHASGVYFYRLAVNDFSQIKKMVLLR